MNKHNWSFRLTWIIALILIVMVLPNIGLSRAQSPAQQSSSEAEDQRDIIRRLANEAPQKIARARRKRVKTSQPAYQQPDYKFIGGSTDQKITGEGIEVGFTLWILKDSRPGEEHEVAEQQERRTKIVSGGKETEKKEFVMVTPKRVNSDTHFNNGDWLRFSLDIPMNGYIYIFNREQFTDGTLGTPALIFPRKIDRGNSDQTGAGKLLLIPNSPDRFEIEETSETDKKKSAEVYYVLVMPKPLPASELSLLEKDEPYREISLKQFQQYEKYSAPILKFESQSEADKAITKIEKLAASDKSESLSDDDPLPQTVYRIAKKPGGPIFFTISAAIRKE